MVRYNLIMSDSQLARATLGVSMQFGPGLFTEPDCTLDKGQVPL